MENQDRSTETNFYQNVQQYSNINDQVPKGTYINACGTGGAGPANDKKVFVGGLSRKTTEKDLQDYFTKFGAIQSVFIKMDQNTGNSKCYGFIVFDTVESANKVIAAGNHVITNKKIDVGFARERHGKVYVTGITDEITDEDIKSFFGRFGNVVGVEIPFNERKDRHIKYCFVIFESVEVAKTVLKNPIQTIKNIQVSIKSPIDKSNEAIGILDPHGRNSYRFRRNLRQPQPGDKQIHGGYNFNQQGYPTMYGGYEGGYTDYGTNASGEYENYGYENSANVNHGVEYENYDNDNQNTETSGGYENYVNYFQNSANVSHGVEYENYGNDNQNTETSGGYENDVNYFENSANVSQGVEYENDGNDYQNTETVIHGAVAGGGAANRGIFRGTTREMSISVSRGANKSTPRTIGRGNQFQPF